MFVSTDGVDAIIYVRNWKRFLYLRQLLIPDNRYSFGGGRGGLSFCVAYLGGRSVTPLRLGSVKLLYLVIYRHYYTVRCEGDEKRLFWCDSIVCRALPPWPSDYHVAGLYTTLGCVHLFVTRMTSCCCLVRISVCGERRDCGRGRGTTRCNKSINNLLSVNRGDR